MVQRFCGLVEKDTGSGTVGALPRVNQPQHSLGSDGSESHTEPLQYNNPIGGGQGLFTLGDIDGENSLCSNT